MRPDVAIPLLIVGLLIVAPLTAFIFTQRRIKTGSRLAKWISWGLRVASLVPWLCVVSVLLWLEATSRNYNPDVTKWVEVQRPADPAEHAIWFYAMDYSDAHWMVARHGTKVYAHLEGWREALRLFMLKPPFVPRVNQFSNYKAFHVSDGWLVGFNEGEFGAALYWFSNDGRRNYKISDAQVVDFLPTPTGIIATQGLAHMGIGYGSIVRLARNDKTGKWTSTEVKDLQAAPESVLRLEDGRMFSALSDSLVFLTADNRLETLVKSTDWVRPDTIVTSADASKVYVGTWQYVFEYDLQTKRFRYLVPDLSFVNKLSKEQETDIRKPYQ